MSNSLLVLASLTTSLIHGGGVIGRLSCTTPSLSYGRLNAFEAFSPNIRDLAAPIAPTNLVSETTHASPDRLLNNIQAVAFIRSLSANTIPSHIPVYPAIDHCTRRGRF